MNFSLHDIAAFSSAIILFGSISYYLIQLFRGVMKPHAFSWFVWMVVTLIIVAGLIDKGETQAALRSGFMALACLTVFLCALRRGDSYITRSDWVMLFLSLAAIPIWLITKEPTLSAIWLLAVEGIAYIPTTRKAYYFPFEEGLVSNTANMVGNILVLMSLQHMTLMALVYFGGWACLQFAFSVVLIWRRLALTGSLRQKALTETAESGAILHSEMMHP